MEAVTMVIVPLALARLTCSWDCLYKVKVRLAGCCMQHTLLWVCASDPSCKLGRLEKGARPFSEHMAFHEGSLSSTDKQACYGTEIGLEGTLLLGRRISTALRHVGGDNHKCTYRRMVRHP